MTGPPITRSVRVGGYALEVGTRVGSFAQFEPKREEENARALAAALAQARDEGRTPVGVIDELQEHAAAVTDRIEQAHVLFRATAEGRLLDADILTREIDVLLSLFERLDQSGRFEEELRLLRALHGLLVLSYRWLDLVGALRNGLAAAEAADDTAAKAWALHELGSLQLCAGDPNTAEESFREALCLKEKLADATSRCATRHNLDCARRDRGLPHGPTGRPRRLLRLAGVVTTLTLLAGGGAAIALAIGGGSGGDDGGSTTPAAVSEASPSDSDTSPRSSNGQASHAGSASSPTDTHASSSASVDSEQPSPAVSDTAAAETTQPDTDASSTPSVETGHADTTAPDTDPVPPDTTNPNTDTTDTAASVDTGSVETGPTDTTGSDTDRADTAATTSPADTALTDTTGPSVTLDAPTDRALIATPTPTISGRAGTEPGDRLEVAISITRDTGQPISEAPLVAPVKDGTWAAQLALTLEDGSYRVSAEQLDDAGNRGTSETTIFTIDTAGPKLTLTCPPTLTSFTPTCELTSSDAGTASLDIYTVTPNAKTNETATLLPDSPTLKLEPDTPAKATLKLPTPLPVNLVAIRTVAIQTDAAGNKGLSNLAEIGGLDPGSR